MNQEANNVIPQEAAVPTPETTPVVPVATPEVAPVVQENAPTVVEPVVAPAPIEQAVAETPTEVATTNTVMPQEPELPAEEPVMIAMNIDEVPVEASSPVQQDTVVDIPVEGPELGQPETNTEETVPTFQQFPEVEPETTSDATAEETISNPPAVDMTAMENQLTVPLPSPEEQPYQATSNQNVPTFQQLGDVPVETPPMANEGEETIDTEEEEEQPKKKRSIIPLIIIGIVIVLVLIVGYIGLTSRNNRGGNIPSLRPERSAEGNINVAVMGHVESPKADVFSSLTKYYGTEVPKESLETCEEYTIRSVRLYEKITNISTESRSYNLIYPCDFLSTQKYIIASDGEDTVDGIILVVSSKEGVMPQTREMILTASKTSTEKIAVYITNDGDVSKTEDEVKDLLKKYNFDVTNTPIVSGGASDETSLKELMKKVDSWINRITEYNGPSAVESHKKMKLYTFLKPKEMDGLKEELVENDKLDFEVLDKKVEGTISFEEGVDKVLPGDVAELTVKLSKNTPLEVGLRVPVYKDDNIVGIGVVSELK